MKFIFIHNWFNLNHPCLTTFDNFSFIDLLTPHTKKPPFKLFILFLKKTCILFNQSFINMHWWPNFYISSLCCEWQGVIQKYLNYVWNCEFNVNWNVKLFNIQTFAQMSMLLCKGFEKMTVDIWSGYIHMKRPLLI